MNYKGTYQPCVRTLDNGYNGFRLDVTKTKVGWECVVPCDYLIAHLRLAYFDYTNLSISLILPNMLCVPNAQYKTAPLLVADEKEQPWPQT
jgi:hypothetical protein